ETIFLILKGELPTPAQTKMMNAIFTAVVDHGPGTPSAQCARISASAKNDLHASVAAGLLGLGGRHGAVVEPAMKFFYDNIDELDLAVLLRTMKEKKQYAPGFGHKIFTVDPRAQTLFDIAKETGVYGKYAEFAEKVETVLNSTASKKLPLNADGAIAALLCDLGFDARVGDGIFVIARVPGLVAQVVEEIISGEGIRRVEPEEIEYNGSSERNLI
ncbi:MAG: citryl-CoA lyase, partial [Patescibacteria group bacterium]